MFVATEGSRTICTVTLIGDRELGLPMESIYPDQILWVGHQRIETVDFAHDTLETWINRIRSISGTRH
jgi:hypothetical protein